MLGFDWDKKHEDELWNNELFGPENHPNWKMRFPY